MFTVFCVNIDDTRPYTTTSAFVHSFVSISSVPFWVYWQYIFIFMYLFLISDGSVKPTDSLELIPLVFCG